MVHFEELQLWQEGVDLATEIYRIARKVPFSKDFGLSNQRILMRNILLNITTLVFSISIGHSQVDYQRLLNAQSESASWLTYSRDYRSYRHSPLKQINATNVHTLRAAWVYQIKRPGWIEATPIVADGVMYITEPPSTVTALDVRTGRSLWSWTPLMPDKLIHHGFPPVNRGVAILNQTVYVGTLDAHLYALDSKSGAVRWKVKLGENKSGYAITVAPLAIKDKIIIGISGGEAGIRGFLDAYDSKTGEPVWRFYTVPGEGEPGNETWGGDSWKTGGGPTWITGSYDPDLNLLYWGVGNPGPDWNGDMRPGDNLYTCSLIALDPDSGELKWYFQFTPHDTHDWDANQTPILVDLNVNGKQRKCIATANRNGFYYLLDRTNGDFILGKTFAKQTWASGLNEDGSPIVLPNTEPTEEGVLIYPSLQGATNWASPAYHPEHKLFYIAVREMGSYYYKTDVEYEPGAPFLGGGEQALSGDNAYGAVRALDVRTGERKWEFKVTTPLWVGVMSTAGNLVFGSTNEGNFYALHAKTGEPLWDFQLGASIRSNPIPFLICWMGSNMF